MGRDLGWGWWYVPVADTLNSGDSISSGNEYIRENCYIWSTTFGGASGPWVSQWNDIGDHYIGVRITSPELVYGWIRVNVSGTRCITVKDYAINKRTFSSISHPDARVTPIIFPNPASSSVGIKWNLAKPDQGRFSVYTSAGNLFYQADCPAGQATRTLDVSTWPAGLYLVRTETDDRTAINRLVIIH
ncbi:MAG: T9SS type A sorting domain-containing protein [bacterium]